MSSPRGGSPGAERGDQHETHRPRLQNDDSEDNDLSVTSTSSTGEDSRQPPSDAPRPESEPDSKDVGTDEQIASNDGGHADDQLASQLNQLVIPSDSSRETIAVDQAQDAAPSLPPLHPHIANMPPRSTSHMVPLQHPIDLNHSLPPTPREEQSSQDFPSTGRLDRRSSAVSFQEQDEASTTRLGGPATRDYNLERQGSFPASVSGSRATQHSPPRVQNPEGREEPEFVPPRWQPDAEVTYCPICQTQFSIFVRKHHCRKCGRVVCNSCSPHRIIIPHQYIVRPPGSEIPQAPGYLYEGLVGSYTDVNGPAGGERVRLCNPCVPDPQTAPPQSPTGASASGSARSAHQRSRSSFGSGYGSVSSSSRYPGTYVESRGSEQWRGYSARTRSITVVPGRAGSSGSSSRAIHHGSLQRLTQPGSSYPTRHSSLAGASSSSRNRMLPPTPQIAEEDECPICHRELPSRELPNFEAVREAHINGCIQSHSTYGSPRTPAAGGEEPSGPAPAARRTGMYKYVATEKDCIDDAECTICLEEFTVGIGMARLECLCRFHRSCISAWFVNHPGRCPVHQHDGFGF